MLERFVSVTRATIKGSLLIGLIQGSLAGIAFYFAGIDGAAFWGTLMVVLQAIRSRNGSGVGAYCDLFVFDRIVGIRNPPRNLVRGCGGNRRQFCVPNLSAGTPKCLISSS